MIIPTKFIDIDFETKSELDLTVVGSKKYALHPSTQMMMISFSIDQKKIFNFNPYFPNRKSGIALQYLLSLVQKKDYAIRAHGSEFECNIWNHVCTKQFDYWPKLPLEKFYCTLTECGIDGLPLGLAQAAIASGVDQHKQEAGTALINFFSKPITKGGSEFRDPLEHKEKFYEFMDYCDQDVKTQIAVSNFCSGMSQREWEIFILTERMNQRGIPINEKMCHGALKLQSIYQAEANERILKITKGAIHSPNQTVFLTRWLRKKGSDIPNLKKETVEKYLTLNLPKKIRKVLLLRQGTAKSSVAKFRKALDQLTEKKRVHGALKALLAITGRWKGRGIQIQNYPKPSKDFPSWCDYQYLAHLIEDVDTETITFLFGDVMEALKASCRSMIRAKEGFKFLSADYAQVEARITMWLAGDKGGLKAFANNDLIYEKMAGVIFNMDWRKVKKGSFERDVAKECVLGCGFGMGPDRFLQTCVDKRGLDIKKPLAVKAVKTYKITYKAVPVAWKDCGKAAIRAIESPGVSFMACNGMLTYTRVGKKLYCRLPSGRKICYLFPRVRLEENKWGYDSKNVYYKCWSDAKKAG